VERKRKRDNTSMGEEVEERESLEERERED
jgi:hypothetical protein